MADIKPTIDTDHSQGESIKVVTWDGLSASDSQGEGVKLGQWCDRCFQFTGISSETVNVQGSNDGSTWNNLKDVFGNEIALTANGIVQIAELPLYTRPFTSGGSGIKAVMMARMPNPLRS